MKGANTILDALTKTAIAGAIVGTLRGQDREEGIAQRRGLQLGKSGQFQDYDQLMDYARETGSPIHKQYAGTNAMDWLKTAAMLGLLSTTGRPGLAIAGGMQAMDWQFEKAARSKAFQEAFEANLPEIQQL